jgi:hypothetical protein
MKNIYDISVVIDKVVSLVDVKGSFAHFLFAAQYVSADEAISLIHSFILRRQTEISFCHNVIRRFITCGFCLSLITA